MSHSLRGLTTRLAGLTAGLNMVVLNAVGTKGVALNAWVGLTPTLTGMFATTWEILTKRPTSPHDSYEDRGPKAQ